MRVSGRKLAIAVIDDDEAILDAVRLALEELQWDVGIYATGDVFLADFDDREPPDCVILDPHLQGISGGEVARALARRTASIPIIGWTARPTSPLAMEVAAAGARVVLTKPVTSRVLVHEVLAAIAAQRQ
jgi:FixJ family two-component response regulator